MVLCGSRTRDMEGDMNDQTIGEVRKGKSTNVIPFPSAARPLGQPRPVGPARPEGEVDCQIRQEELEQTILLGKKIDHLKKRRSRLVNSIKWRKMNGFPVEPGVHAVKVYDVFVPDGRRKAHHQLRCRIW